MFSFDLQKFLNESDFVTVTEGTHKAVIVGAELEQKMNGTLLKMTFEIVDGPCKGGQVVQTAWVEHSNPKAKWNGENFISQICIALDFMQGFQQFEQVYGKPMTIHCFKEKFTKNDGTEGEATRIEKVSKVLAGNSPNLGNASAMGGPDKDDLPY